MTTLTSSGGLRTGRREAFSRPARFALRTDSVSPVEAGDSLLMARVSAGDEDALAEIWSRHASMVFGHARRLTTSASIAEEITQEVFVSLWTRPDRFDESRGTLRTFLALDTRGKSIDAVRHNERRRIREQRQFAMEPSAPAEPQSGMDPHLTTTVREAIERLPDKQREAVELAYFSGLTQSEVATSLGIPEGTAKSRLRLAQAKLRTWLDQTLLGIHMTGEPNTADPMLELRAALAQADAQRPPDHLLQTVLDTALGKRRAGRSVLEVAAITAAEAFERSMASLGNTLSSLREEDWRRPTIRDLDVQGLVGHLTGVEAAFCDSVTSSPGHDPDADHVRSTDRFVDRQYGRPGASTYLEWREASERSLALVRSVGAHVRPDEVFALHGLRLSFDALLIVRSFELWTHEEDIRRATDRHLGSPDAPTLQLMTDLAFGILPGAIDAALDGSGVERRIRFVLTGPGGRTWDWQPALAEPETAGPHPWALRIVMPAVDFCRLVANRIDLEADGIHLDGDGDLAPAVYAAASGLALD